ncbi:MAG: MBL fold metallo-hydrolase [Labilithrix sp.]|nr:MBL fold metallo-hydrolase [Labilithrix sp.]MCW5818228.1 MBL fold metallo-hydrolase [Labilithrix sp.]
MRFAPPGALLFVAAFVGACAETTSGPPVTPTTSGGPPPPAPVGDASAAACGDGAPLTVRFYDSGQALAVLLTLPDGRQVLVDAGESPRRPCAGCKAWHERVMSGLRRDVGARGLDALWITHQHSDHVGGAEAVLTTFKTALYVDNGLDLDKTAVIRDARAAAAATDATIHVVDPERPASPIAEGGSVRFTPILPSKWTAGCPRDPNECSIGLRVDYCKSSLLFTGDAPVEEEDAWDLRGEVTLLQVGHHGSETSTGPSFLERARPKYAVISAAKQNEGTNDGYCHPSAAVVEELTAAMGGPGAKTVRAFDATNTCVRGGTDNWRDVPASDSLWVTARDGDVVLRTIGDGTFTRE